MEAARASGRPSPRDLPSGKANRIIEAMRVSVAARGFAGSTFDQVAREAGVSRGLLHYYFGTKENLLIEAVRREADVRMETLDRAVADAVGPDQVLAALVASFEQFLGEGPSHATMFFEVLTLAQRNAEIATELSALMRRVRVHVADVLRAKAQAGVLELKADPDGAAEFLIALADGITVRRLGEPQLDVGPVMGASIQAARALLG
jgi:AcrR family transcriptional regulator